MGFRRLRVQSAPMPFRLECPYCGRTGFVRTERVIKGGRAVTAYFCGACTRKWEKPDEEPPPPQGRGRIS